MNFIKTGGPAFPQPAVYDASRDQVNEASAYGCDQGMALRDYFAAKAMQAAITTSGGPWMTRDQACADAVAQMAYQVADSMLKARQG